VLAATAAAAAAAAAAARRRAVAAAAATAAPSVCISFSTAFSRSSMASSTCCTHPL
jgi:hypothetical protein